jgi:hypothetical protein
LSLRLTARVCASLIVICSAPLGNTSRNYNDLISVHHEIQNEIGSDYYNHPLTYPSL